jgi:hypothetical protein
MRTEYWIVVCAVFVVASFFAGVLYGEATSRPMIDSVTDQRQELELLVDSLERRETELLSARERGVEPNLPPKHVPASGKVIRE